MRILVLGSRGFIGSHVLSETNHNSVQVIGLSRQECDFLDHELLAKLIRGISPDLVVNAAGIVAGIQGNIEHPYKLISINSQLSLSIAKSCLDAGVENYLSFSAACVYPSGEYSSLQTKDLWSGKPEVSSLSYATAKLLNLQLNESVNAEFGLKWKTIIPSNLYGVKENLGQIDSAAHVLESLIAKSIHAKKLGLKEVEVWGDGSPKRTFLHVKDLAQATVHVALYANELPSIVNVNGSEEVSIQKLAESVAEFAEFHGVVKFNENMPNGAPRKNLDDSVLRKTGWKPKMEFYSELKKLVVHACS